MVGKKGLSGRVNKDALTRREARNVAAGNYFYFYFFLKIIVTYLPTYLLEPKGLDEM